jgi:hypothetical protein
MKQIMLIAALCTVGACSEREFETAPEASEVAAAPEVTEPLAADGQQAVGNYKITTSEGEVLMEELRADGTYTATIDGRVVETGNWVQKSPELYCYTKDEEGATEQCNTESIDEEGVWTSRDAEGNVATVERIEA